jgi:hypothetical protein
VGSLPLIDHSTLPADFTGKIPTHFDFTVKHYKSNPIRLNRALERWKIRGKEPTDVEMHEAVILDYLIQFVHNYILNKRKANPMDLEIPDMPKGLDLADGEKEIIEMIDAALQRGIRSKSVKKALDIFENQVQSMYNRLLALINDEISVGESIIYGIFNMNDIEISRDDALELIQKHFRRMKVSLNSSGKKRIDSAIIKAVCIEVEEKVLKRAMK